MTNPQKPRRMARPLTALEAAPAPTEVSSSERADLVQTAKRPTKQSLVLELLRAGGGTTLGAIVDATGWQAHTARAVLTELRKKGHSIERMSVDGVTRYRITGAAAQ